ncbi:uncharacterized protein N7506_001819 [Penicillium brevicompactum]|uniref:uncharacterized protein n=1 Tax=Penicillium brevicompactum TaxID=5074 RepID=UPI00253F69BF|nr:uncharacterized protein N7506_001819 [Penicillium brevicompactum]KAJ5348566.1 hypothetical protein N7506_001819 [Penicillium brevicompactum]
MAAWLGLVSENEVWNLVDTNRLEELVQELPYPKWQYPSLLYFTGNSNCMKALRALFPYNNITRKGPAGLIRLHLSAKTAHTQSPILFAESSLNLEHSMGDSKWLKHSTTKHRSFSITGTEGLLPPARLQQEVKRELVLPWTQVLCLFLDSAADIQAARNLLQQPRRQLTIGDEGIPAPTQIVIVLTNGKHTTKAFTQEYAQLQKTIKTGTVTILDLSPRSGLSDSVAFAPLESLILKQLGIVQAEQLSACRRFSAVHLSAFWNTHVQIHQRLLDAPPFDLLERARRGYTKNDTMGDCLREVSHHRKSVSCSREDFDDLVATAFLMDAYPPGMHGFSPILVFAAIYEKLCLSTWDAKFQGHIAGVSFRFVQSFGQLSSVRTSAAIRKETLHRLYRRWGGLRSTTTCLVCLCRPPEHMLPCKHAVCDTCVVIFGTPSSLGEYHFEVAQCPICDARSNVTVRQLPPTKHPVILSLDGGGVRGLIQLGLLRALERRIGVPIASLPDLCTGTSVGALSAIDIILSQSSVTQCFNAFPGFARKIFRRTSNSPVPRCIRWLASAFNLTTDGLYDSDGLSQIFKAAVGPSRRMFDVAMNSSAGCRVAIVASRTSDGKACILANYRGANPRSMNAAYLFLAPHGDRGNPFLWEAAICSVAAPFYFQTKNLPGLGLLQDGGVRANNPLAIALRESNIIWPMAKRHDLLLSVGTGFSTSSPSDSTGFLDRIWEGALPRLFRAMMSSPSMDGKQGFLEALNYLPHSSTPDIVRLDQAIDGTLPALDDTCSLEKMSNMDFAVPAELVRSILASAMFFFELDESPVQGNASFYCRGSVLCSRPNPSEILQRVLVEFPGARFRSGQDHDLGSIDPVDICQLCGYFRKRVAFRVTSLEERVSIEIANDTFREKIGGFPKSAIEFLDEQKAHAQFGRADHQSLDWPPRRTCYCYRGSKRLVHFLEPAVGQKRRRL